MADQNTTHDKNEGACLKIRVDGDGNVVNPFSLGGEENKDCQDLYDEVEKAFQPLKEILDKYPNVFSLGYYHKEGYFIEWDLTYLVPIAKTLVSSDQGERQSG